MSRFRDLLRRTNERLDLPQPEKSRILLEIAADLEDAFERYRSEGLGEDEAVRRAEEKFEVSDEALRELVEVHTSVFRKLLGRISGQAQTRWERALLVAVVVCIAAFAGRELLSAELFGRAGSFVWVVAGTGVAALVLTVIKTYTIYIRRDHDVRRLRTGLHWLPVLGGLSLAVGLYGVVLGLYRTVGSVPVEPAMHLGRLIGWGIRSSALALTGMLVSVAAGLVWFVLTNRVRALEVAETAWLLDRE